VLVVLLLELLALLLGVFALVGFWLFAELGFGGINAGFGGGSAVDCFEITTLPGMILVVLVVT
jgi:hypothetical protein